MRVLFILISLFLAGCASNNEEYLNGWIGKTEDDLVSRFGIPFSTYKLNNGDKMLEFRFMAPNGINYCAWTFTTNNEGIVSNWRQTGNCR